MSNLLCGKCGKECNASNVYVCSDCGSFICNDCRKSAGEICPDCFGRLNKLC